jgi:hypothetical protein
MKAKAWMCGLLLGGGAALQVPAQAQADSAADPDEHGAYLSLGFGNGRMQGGDFEGNRAMRGRAFEVRAGRSENEVFGGGRIDFVHYNEGHPDNNHRDGFAVQWLAVRPLLAAWTGELGIGPYLSMNTTVVAGRQIDDAHWGLLLSGALRIPLDAPLRALPPGTQLRIGLNYAYMPDAHRSIALLVGLGRQFGPTRPDPDTEPSAGPWWFGASAGNSITNMAGTNGARAAVLEARRYLGERFEHWAVSTRFLLEGDDGARVDRRGVAAQLWYVQQVTPRFSMSAGMGPYVARNRRDNVDPTSGNLLISFQAERALTHRTRVFLNFNRVKTFRDTDDRDLFQLGVSTRF